LAARGYRAEHGELGMKPETKVAATKHLKRLGQCVATAEALLSAGNHTAAMRALLEARRLGGQATAVLMADCLQQSLAGVNSPDRRTREASVDEFIRLVDFVESTLCVKCRRRVAARLKEK
jgi:uncharacterized protein with beta-barrel porin domain